MVFYQWRLNINDRPTHWTDTSAEDFLLKQKNNFFGKGCANNSFFEGRIIKCESAEITMVTDKEA